MLIIDRFEGAYAIIENDDEFFSILKEQLPDDAAEGDILIENEHGYFIDKEATLNRRLKLMRRLKSISIEEN